MKLKKFFFLFIQNLHNYRSHIEDVHILFCAHFMNIYLFLRGIELSSTNAKMVPGMCTRAGSKVMQPMMLNDNERWDCIFAYFKLLKYPPFTDTQGFKLSIQSLKVFL